MRFLLFLNCFRFNNKRERSGHSGDRCGNNTAGRAVNGDSPESAFDDTARNCGIFSDKSCDGHNGDHNDGHNGDPNGDPFFSADRLCVVSGLRIQFWLNLNLLF